MLASGGLLFLAALMLGGLDHGVTALPNPFLRKGQNLDKRQTITLNEDCSCNDLSNYQTQTGVGHITADMYDMYNKVDAHGNFINYRGGSRARSSSNTTCRR